MGITCTLSATFSTTLKTKIKAITSISDITDTVDWLTNELKKDPNLTVYGAGSLFSYERNFCQPILTLLKKMQAQYNLSDNYLANELETSLTELIETFHQVKVPKAYLERFNAHLTQLNQLYMNIIPYHPTDATTIANLTRLIEEIHWLTDEQLSVEQKLKKIKQTNSQALLLLAQATQEELIDELEQKRSALQQDTVTSFDQSRIALEQKAQDALNEVRTLRATAAEETAKLQGELNVEVAKARIIAERLAKIKGAGTKAAQAALAIIEDAVPDPRSKILSY